MLDDTVGLLELDTGQNQTTTYELLDKINTLKDTIQARNDYEEEEKARKYMAQRNLEAETPNKNFCNQINKSKKKGKLSSLLQERKLTPEETLTDPTQKQFEEILCQTKIKSQVRDFYANLYNHKPSAPDNESIENAIGNDNIKTLTPEELAHTEKEITMNEIEFCLNKTKNNISPGSSGFTGAIYKAFWSSLKYPVHKTINAIYDSNELPEFLCFGIVNIIPKGNKDH